VTTCDVVVILDETLFGATVLAGLRPEGRIVINTLDATPYREAAEGREVIALDATTLALDILGRPITNTAMLGVLIAGTGIVRLESAAQAIRHEMKPKIADKNVQLLERAFQLSGGQA
jgi:pyruvate ferredoxin oxidoreductase gamma subunit